MLTNLLFQFINPCYQILQYMKTVILMSRHYTTYFNFKTVGGIIRKNRTSHKGIMSEMVKEWAAKYEAMCQKLVSQNDHRKVTNMAFKGLLSM